MKVRFKGNGKRVIQGIAREFRNGDTIDLPDDVGEELLRVDSRHFDEVMEKPIATEYIDLKKKKKKIKEIKIEEDEGG